MLVDARLITHLPMWKLVGLRVIKIQCYTTIYPELLDGSKDDQHLNDERSMNILVGNPAFTTT